MHRLRTAWSPEGRSLNLSRALLQRDYSSPFARAASCRRAFATFRPAPSLLATNLSDRHQLWGSSSSTRCPYSTITPTMPQTLTKDPVTATHDTKSEKTVIRKKKVLLLMSGGVDSSMCAVLLKEQGYDVTGLYMHNWNHEEETRDTPDDDDGDDYSDYKNASHRTSQRHPHPHRNTLHLTEHLPKIPSGGRPPKRGTSNHHPRVCTSERDWADVQDICRALEIPCRRLDFSRQYWHQVFEVMLQGYEQGMTPNPDIDCNREIKFGQLVDWCHANGGLGPDRPGLQRSRGVGSSMSNGEEQEEVEPEGWDYLATGHYAHVVIDEATGRAKLMRARDSNKDQTYYLSTLSEQVLRHVKFPLADLDKPTIKAMAAAPSSHPVLKRIVGEKKESMGICFVGQRRRFGDFLKEYLQPTPGLVRIGDLDGKIIGRHQGLFQYTVGQASGVTYGHYKWVVLRSDIPTNTLIVVEGTQNPLLYSSGLTVGSWHWISGQAPPSLPLATGVSSTTFTSPTTITAAGLEYPFVAQIRHRQTPQPCRIEVIPPTSLELPSPSDAQIPQFRVLFKDAQRAIAPGQHIVVYRDDECLGSGVILSSLPSSSQ
ncbi:hypothetical protein BGZ73_004464 [Actinomortierella ambigua]|nr:hypothetical protein BGZ73_004464 [Actinomortierella ambigua]